jgi:hypothetical protein
MTSITIPPEAIEAAAIELAPAPWSMYTEDAREHFRRKARAALAAGLAAWPGMSIAPEDQGVYLPLPKENTNAES